LSFYRNTSSENLAMRQHACAFLPSLATKILRQIPSTYLRTVPKRGTAVPRFPNAGATAQCRQAKYCESQPSRSRLGRFLQKTP